VDVVSNNGTSPDKPLRVATCKTCTLPEDLRGLAESLRDREGFSLARICDVINLALSVRRIASILNETNLSTHFNNHKSLSSTSPISTEVIEPRLEDVDKVIAHGLQVRGDLFHSLYDRLRVASQLIESLEGVLTNTEPGQNPLSDQQSFRSYIVLLKEFRDTVSAAVDTLDEKKVVPDLIRMSMKKFIGDFSVIIQQELDTFLNDRVYGFIKNAELRNNLRDEVQTLRQNIAQRGGACLFNTLQQTKKLEIEEVVDVTPQVLVQ